MSHSAKKKPPKGGGAGSCFLGCFGFLHKDYYDDVDDISKEKLKSFSDGVINKAPKKRKWFSWARKQRSDIKTVPLDTATVPEKPRRSWSKDVKKVKNIGQPLVKHEPSPPPQSTPAPRNTNRTRSNNDQHTTLGNKKSSSKTTLDSIEEAICEENNSPPPNRTATAIATTTATTVSTTINGKQFGHSVSLPLIYKGKKLATTNSGGGPLTTAARKSKDMVVGGKVDSVVGMSIILVMLLIMLLWGKVCAILCTSAWFYLVPRLRMKNDSPSKASKHGSSIADQIDIDSQEYKKKVELEGFLERNNHRKMLFSAPNN